jgi:hypothetical protein
MPHLTQAARVLVLITIFVLGAESTATAVSPRNPYRSFNLSGINYGSMRWEQAQRQGRRVWPSTTTPSGKRGRTIRNPTLTVGGFSGGGVVNGGGRR